LADRSIKRPYGIVEDLLVKVDKFLFPVDFVVMDIEEDVDVPLILGRPFMKTVKVVIDVDKGKLKVCVDNEEVSFNVFEAVRHPKDTKSCFRIDVIEEECGKQMKSLSNHDVLLQVITKPAEELLELGDIEALALAKKLDQAKELVQKAENREILGAKNVISEESVELKALPPHFKYNFIEENAKKPVILSSSLTVEEERRLIEVLKLN